MIDEKNKKNPESIDNEEGVKEERSAARLDESDKLENTAGAATGEKVREGSEVREKVMNDSEVHDKSETSEIDELKALRDEIKNLKDENARLRAEFINYRNALVRESEESIRRYREKIIIRLIEIYDNLSRALENSDNSKKSLISGIKLIHKSV
ncbi:MAG: nucleotide exchange factor GrpE, partial [Mesotoga sp.]|nr:nucleotide exchange factor GrpE [Mesotoga sp.]